MLGLFYLFRFLSFAFALNFEQMSVWQSCSFGNSQKDENLQTLRQMKTASEMMVFPRLTIDIGDFSMVFPKLRCDSQLWFLPIKKDIKIDLKSM